MEGVVVWTKRFSSRDPGAQKKIESGSDKEKKKKGKANK
jgi:hypothetical protein